MQKTKFFIKWYLQSLQMMILSCQVCIQKKHITYILQPSQLRCLRLGRGGETKFLLVSPCPASSVAVSCRQCAGCVFFEGSFHSRLEHNSCSYVGDEAAFHFVLQSYGWASEKIMLSCFMKCCCCIGTVTVELRQKKKSLSSVFLVCTCIQEFVRCKETHVSVVSFYPKKILPNKKYFSVLLQKKKVPVPVTA